MDAQISRTHCLLIVLSETIDEHLVADFCGDVVFAHDGAFEGCDVASKTVFLCGDLSRAHELELAPASRVLVIQDFSHHDTDADWPRVEWGQVPRRVHGVGILYPRFFDPDVDYFQQIQSEHTFQALTESTKSSKAHRSGIYLTPVQRRGPALHFRLLRCSTNLAGPTENFAATDTHIVDALNQEAARVFQNPAPMNHVLAQIYHNTPASPDKKQTKAKIQAHADKTKDMPAHGIMAFCTFYQGLHRLTPLKSDPFDYGKGETSGLTKLHFRLKNKREHAEGSLPEQFTVTLYPNSVFLMPLSTNRLYTHEIRASMLNAEDLPTRLGYVVRCSSTEAVHQDGRTWLKTGDGLVELQPASEAGMTELRQLYAQENRTEATIDYAGKFLFSMNQGDYCAPSYRDADEFRRYDLTGLGNPFDALYRSVRFEGMTKGRQGTVLVDPDPQRGIPIVRTTTRYNVSAQCFRPIHTDLVRRIQARASLPHGFNNALIEHYTPEYSKMGAHSDQAQDLQDGSVIALFSCYQYPDRHNALRTLVIEAKDPPGEPVEIPLLHNSVVVFSLDTNRRFRHKIVPNQPGNAVENSWLGITFRLSKTFVQPGEAGAQLEGGDMLTLATQAEAQEFYRLRGHENKTTDFEYPRLTYTLSPSDLMPPAR